MTYDEICTMFSGCSFPVYNEVSDAGTSLPYGVLLFEDGSNAFADDITYCINNTCTLELYTLGKDFKAIEEVQQLLNANHLPFNHDTSYLDGQQVMLEGFYFGVPGGAVPLPEPTPEPEPEPEPEPAPEPEPEEDSQEDPEE